MKLAPPVLAITVYDIHYFKATIMLINCGKKVFANTETKLRSPLIFMEIDWNTSQILVLNWRWWSIWLLELIFAAQL